MTETMWKVVEILYYLYLERGKDGYATLWHLRESIGDLAGCGVPDGDDAVERLLKLGLIEELPDLGCRYRIVVRDGAE